MTSEMNFEGVKMTSKISISEFAKISCGIQFNLSFGMQFPKTCFRKVILEYNYKIEKKELPKMEFRNFFGIPFSEMEKKSAIVPSATPTTTFEKPPQITTVLVSNCQKTAKRKKHQRCFPQRTHLKWRWPLQHLHQYCAVAATKNPLAFTYESPRVGQTFPFFDGVQEANVKV